MRAELLERITLQGNHCFSNAGGKRAARVAVLCVEQTIAQVSIACRSQNRKRAHIGKGAGA